MTSSFQAETGTRMLSAIALFCYSVALAGLLAFGYSLIELALNVAGQGVGAIYSSHAM